MSIEATAVQMTPTLSLDEATDQQVYILFAVWFEKKRGRDVYANYLKEASPIANQYGAHREESWIPVEPVTGGFDPDYMYVTSWPSMTAYYDFLKDKHYRIVAPLLLEATRKQAVLAMRPPITQH